VLANRECAGERYFGQKENTHVVSRRSKGLQWWPPIVGGGSLLLLWALVVTVGHVPAFIVPAPWDVIAEIGINRVLLLQNFTPTLIEALSGFTLGNAMAMTVAILFVEVRLLRRMYLPVAILFNTIPVIALAPILVLVFGLNMAPKIFIAAFICFFPALINMIRGLESVTPSELELMRMVSATPVEVLLRLRLPRALPFLFSALRIAATGCVIGAIVGEWIGSTEGIGALIIQATFNYRSGLLYAAITVSSAFALTLFGLVVLVEHRTIRWNA
jgi:NitT/TauT family transport system permease protein